MGFIMFNLVNAATLGTLVPVVGGVAALPAGLAGPGMYIIYNSNTNNRYVGKAADFGARFQPRMEAVGELGFSVPQLDQIIAYWGSVDVQQTATAMNPAPAFITVTPFAYTVPNVTAALDGQNIQLERLLVRFIMTQGWGGFVTNNIWAAPGATYTNPTGNPILVRVNYGAVPGTAAGHRVSLWNPGAGGAW